MSWITTLVYVILTSMRNLSIVILILIAISCNVNQILTTRNTHEIDELFFDYIDVRGKYVMDILEISSLWKYARFPFGLQEKSDLSRPRT